MKIVAFVPIKLKSRRLKNKMRLPLGDKMLFQHIFDKLLNVKQDIDIYCYCSDNSIEKDLPSSVKFLQRDTYLDGDEIKGIQIYESFINDVDGDIYLLCHATSPFLKSKTIEIGLNKVIEKGYDSAFSVNRIQTFSWFNGKPLNYKFDDVVRTQNLEPVFWETSAFYIFKKKVLTKSNRRIGEKHFMVETDRIESIDIDEKQDYEIAKKLI
jgi:CMP-N-acetylneuraminic acid synthetase|tara:strand:- start:3892 stop:4524 length:633 start_codon:yes stop_codon:yes gene_type:complete